MGDNDDRELVHGRISSLRITIPFTPIQLSIIDTCSFICYMNFSTYAAKSENMWKVFWYPYNTVN